MKKSNLWLLLAAGAIGYALYKKQSVPKVALLPRVAGKTMTGFGTCGEYGELCPPYSKQQLGCMGCAGMGGDALMDGIAASAI